MHFSGLDYLAVAGAAGAAGVINALAGGGTLVSFPTLVGIGVPPVDANVTNTVAVVPGYLGGSWAQREELIPQLEHARVLAAVSAAGGLAGSVLLVAIPGHAFRTAVPYLILLSSVLLLAQDRVRALLNRGVTDPSAVAAAGVDAGAGVGSVAPGAPKPTLGESGPGLRAALLISVFAGAVYGGFFGAGLGIMLLAVLGVFGSGGDSLTASNALKQALSFVINVVAAIFLAFSGHVQWEVVPVMAAASVAGGFIGGRFVSVVNAQWLRGLVVATGVAVAVAFWVG